MFLLFIIFVPSTVCPPVSGPVRSAKETLSLATSDAFPFWLVHLPAKLTHLPKKLFPNRPAWSSRWKAWHCLKKPRHLQPRIRMFLCGVQLAGWEKDPGSSLGCQKLNLSFKTWHRTWMRFWFLGRCPAETFHRSLNTAKETSLRQRRQYWKW